MKPFHRDCRILEPVLVSHVYGEPHPDLKLLLAHLRICARCRVELDQLRSTQEWLDGVAVTQDEDAPGCRPWWRRQLPVAAAAAAALVVAWILVGALPLRSGAVASETGELGGGSALLSRASLEMSPVAFGVDELDARLEALEGQIAKLREEAW